LAQIMAGGGQKAGFGDIGAFGLQLGRFSALAVALRSEMSAKVMTTPSTRPSRAR
jgi:hypothetical protein